MVSRNRAAFLASVAVIAITTIAACSGSTASSTTTSSVEVSTTTAPPPTTTSIERDVATTNVLFDFPDRESVRRWSNIDDSVMGGISSSTSTWIDTGGLLFSGTMTTESNGGFTSVLGPAEERIGERSAATLGLGVDAVGDGRTYVLQLRAGVDGRDRWIARFTPIAITNRSTGNIVTIPFDSFQPVDRFLRPTTPSAPLDPSTILQIGIYLIDGQVGDFRLAVRSILAVR